MSPDVRVLVGYSVVMVGHKATSGHVIRTLVCHVTCGPKGKCHRCCQIRGRHVGTCELRVCLVEEPGGMVPFHRNGTVMFPCLVEARDRMEWLVLVFGRGDIMARS